MKKVASLLLICVLVLTMGVGAFAAEDPTALHGGHHHYDGMHHGMHHDTHHGNQYGAHYGNQHGAHYGGRSTSLRERTDLSEIPGAMPFESENDVLVFDDYADIAPSLAWTGAPDTLRIAPGEMFLVQSGSIVLPEALLVPNREYIFDVYYNVTDASIDQVITQPLESGLMPLIESAISGPLGATTTGRMRLRSGRGSNMFSRTELRTRGSGPTRGFQVVLETRENYNTRHNDVTFTLLTSGNLPPAPAGEANPIQSTIALTVGWPRISDAEIESYAEGDTVTLSNEYPVVLRRQIDRLVRNHNYRAIHLAFEDGSWEYTGRMSGMGDTNFYTTQDVIPVLMNRLDQDFKFLTLPAGVTFPTNGEMRIDVSDVSDSWDRIYTYLYRNGTLTPINTSYDSMDDMIYFRTNFLGSFVMTDVEITDLYLITRPEQPEVTTPQVPDHPNVYNPPTGVAMGVNNMLIGLGTFSVLGAGAVITRRRKK